MSYEENRLLCFRSRSQQNLRMSVNVFLNDSLLITEPFTTEPFTTILGIVMHHYEPDCLPKRLVCYLQGQGH